MEIINYDEFDDYSKSAMLFDMEGYYKLRIEDISSGFADLTCYFDYDGNIDEDVSYQQPENDTQYIIVDWAKESIKQYKSGTLYYVTQKAKDERLTAESLQESVDKYIKCCNYIDMDVDEQGFIDRYIDAMIRLENDDY